MIHPEGSFFKIFHSKAAARREEPRAAERRTNSHMGSGVKGTCHFTHDKVNPGGPCYRDPRWPGPLPDK
eukprot:713491-Pleurochrysis_carterae.AAC.1